MITDSFDRSKPIITPGDYYGEQKHILDICIITFSKVIFQEVLDNYRSQSLRKEGEIVSCGGNIPIYSFEIEDLKGEAMRIGILLSSIGSVAAGINITECNWLTGATKFIMFGSAGALNEPLTKGKYVVPAKAYRDEGMSYHYMPPSDYVDVDMADRVGEIFDEIKVPYVKGPCWTTDTWYRETVEQMKARVEDGCLAVDMEVSGAQAVCSFYGWELYCFLVTGDVLGEEEYSLGGLASANHDLDKLHLGFEIAKRI
ncbi:MAG: nucleoside phosphorylase [Firmicutes bacterium]|nr:nucleoside phosphorylase [Bacillota bacterium]